MTPPDPMITRLAQPLLALRASLGQGGDVSAISTALTVASHSIEQIAVGGQSPLAGLPQVWNGPAGTAAASRVGQLQHAAGQIADRGNHIGPIVQQAASDLASDRRQMDAIITQFMSLGTMDPQVLHSASGVTAAITVANNALQQGLAVVAHAGATLADATRALQGLTPPQDQVPAVAPGGIVDDDPAQTNPADVTPGDDAGYSPDDTLGDDGLDAADTMPAAVNSSDPVQVLGSALTSAGASAIGEIAGFVIGDLGEVFDDATNAVGTVFDHLGDAAGTIIDQAITPKPAGQDGAAAGIAGDPVTGQAPFGPAPGTPAPAATMSDGKPVAKPLAAKATGQEPFAGSPDNTNPARPVPQAPTPSPAAQTPDPNVPNEADGGAPVVPLPSTHGPGGDAPRHREQAGVTDASMNRVEPSLENALTA